MRQHALLRSDKGLGIPGTARKKNEPTAAPAIVDNRKDHFVVRNGVCCAGVHLIVDLYDAKHLDDIDHIDEALRRNGELAAEARACRRLAEALPEG